jgi:putative peptide zinc metalloprotease protein
MLQLRPTFSESWYRVVGLKPKLRGTAQISRQYYRGERWYVVRDAASNQFHRLSDAAYRFVGLLDGTRTVGDAWDLVGGTLADDAPTQPEVIQILSQLYAANLVETDIPPDATVLLRRHKKQLQRRLQSKLMNVLFPRIPIWDCDRFVRRWLPLAKVAFSKLGAIIWLLVVGAAVVMVAPHWQDLKQAAQDAVNIRANPENAFYLWLTFVLIKFIHECGHAFSCRRFGGEVHEMGIMFLVFIPTPYVDASTAWAFPSRWQRMFVGAAGMVVELFVAALCAFFWLATRQSNTIWTHLAYNAMLIASVSTVMFNANPLLRYDGYYILSDYLEIPNLQMKSREYLLGLIKRHVFRLKPTQPLPPVGQRVLLFVYGILSTIYRVFVGIVIILVVTWQVPVLGVLMAIGGLVTWLVVPVVKLFKYLTVEPELHRKRGRAWAFSLAVGATAVWLIGFIPFHMHISAQGIVEPENRAVLHASTKGWVKEVVARDGDTLHKGDKILICEDPELLAKIGQMEAEIRQDQARADAAFVANDVNSANAALQSRKSNEEHLADYRRQLSELTITAPIDGMLIAPDLRNYPGRFLKPGDEVATVAKLDTLLVRAAVEQKDSQLYFKYAPTVAQAEVCLVSRPFTVLHAQYMDVIPAGQDQLAHKVLGSSAGGQVPVDPRDPKGLTAATDAFEVRAIVSNPDGSYHPGQSAWVRIKLADEPLFEQWRRRFLQLIDSRASSSKWL